MSVQQMFRLMCDERVPAAPTGMCEARSEAALTRLTARILATAAGWDLGPREDTTEPEGAYLRYDDYCPSHRKLKPKAGG